MYICKVIGKAVATVKNEKLVGSSIVLLRRAGMSSDGEAKLGDEIFAAADVLGCGEGNYVLVTGGSNAALALKDKNAPVDMAVVGILDGSSSDEFIQRIFTENQ